MSNLIDNRKLAFHQVEDEIVGSNSAIIGNRSQLYDIGTNALLARSKFSFTIQHSRIIDISTCAFYNPSYGDLKKEKLQFWFSEEDPLHTDVSQKFDTIFNKACEMKFIKYDSKEHTISKIFDNPSFLLKKCGEELKTWLKEPQAWMTRKIMSVDGIVMLDLINKDKPFFKEINPTDLGLSTTSYVSLISLMQTFGIIKVTNNDRMIPYLSFEIYGDYISKGLDDMLENKFNRTIFEWCRKMPGISLSKIQNLAFETFSVYERESVRSSLEKIITELQQDGFIEIFKNNTNNNIYIVPVWLRNSILKIRPSRIESDMVRNAIRACGALWESLDDLNDYPILLDNIIESLNELAIGNDLTLKEILEIDEHLKPLFISFVDNGIMGLNRSDGQKTTTVSVKSETKDILKIIIDILRISGEMDIWMEFVKGKPTYESMSVDLKNTTKEIHSNIADQYHAKDLKKFSEYK